MQTAICFYGPTLDYVRITSQCENNASNSPSFSCSLDAEWSIHCYSTLQSSAQLPGPVPSFWSWTRWFTAASHLGLSTEGLGILGIPQSAKNIDNALSLTLGWGIDEWLEGHKSDSSGSAPCHSITYPLSSPIKCTRSTSLHADTL